MAEQPPVHADSDTARANAGVVLEFFAQVLGANHDTTDLGRFLSENFVDHDPAGDDSGLSGVRVKLDGLWGALPDAHYVPDVVIAAGEFVTVFSRLVGTSGEVAFADRYRVQGKISEHWHVVDTAALALLLGRNN